MTRKQKAEEFEQGYSITVAGRNVSVTDAMKTHAIDRISKLERIGPKIIHVTVTMDVQKIQNYVDIVMKYGHTLIKSHASDLDMYLAIDKAVEKLRSQLKKYLNKLHEHHSKKYDVVEIPEEVYAGTTFFEEEIILDGEELQRVNDQIEKKTRETKYFEPHRVVSTETQILKILTNYEAIMKMDLSLAKVMIYRDEKDRKLKVIYRRDDGNYGIISPEA